MFQEGVIFLPIIFLQDGIFNFNVEIVKTIASKLAWKMIVRIINEFCIMNMILSIYVYCIFNTEMDCSLLTLSLIIVMFDLSTIDSMTFVYRIIFGSLSLVELVNSSNLCKHIKDIREFILLSSEY